MASAHLDRVNVQVFLVRHGETDFNRRGLVLGQVDEPLTDQGRDQARLLADSSFWKNHIVHSRQDIPLYVYSSDLIRAHETAHILFSQQSAATHEEQQDAHSAFCANNPQPHSHIPIVLDKRLRELGKGAREGLPRTLSYEEALAQQRQSDPQRSPADFGHKKESTHEGWERAKAFLNHVLREAVAKVSRWNHAVPHNDIESISEPPPTREIHQNKAIPDSTPTTITKTIRVVAVSHSGFLRVLLQNLVGKDHLQNHPQARIEASTGLFLIPNTSVTLLEFQLSSRIIMSTDWIDSIMQEFPASIQVRELTWCDHLLKDDDQDFLNGE